METVQFNMPKSNPPPGPSPSLAKMLVGATPQQRAEAAKVTAKLLARRAKREASGEPIDLSHSSRVKGDSPKFWIPGGLPEEAQFALAVPASQRPIDYGLYLSLLEVKLGALLRENPQAARSALEMSREAAPEFWEIAQSYPSQDWAAQIVRADVMTHTLSGLTSEGQLTELPDPPLTLQEILEVIG